jgi:hypothetical protein
MPPDVGFILEKHGVVGIYRGRNWKREGKY